MSTDTLLTLLRDPTVQTVAGGAALLGALAGAAGAFAVVRRRSLQGDAVAHAALPGVALAFLFGATSPLWLVLGGAIAGWVALGFVSAAVRQTKTSYDTALAIVLSTFFGFGLALKSYLQNNVPGAASSGLDHYLIGQAATLRWTDVVVLATVGILITVALTLCWNRLSLVSFDADYAKTIGISVPVWTTVLTATLVVAAVVGLQAVGVVLMSALLVAPAVAARQWTHRLGVLVPLAAGIGAISGVIGTLLSLLLSADKRAVPTGPMIVLVATAAVLISVGAGIAKTRIRSAPVQA